MAIKKWLKLSYLCFSVFKQKLWSKNYEFWVFFSCSTFDLYEWCNVANSIKCNNKIARWNIKSFFSNRCGYKYITFVSLKFSYYIFLLINIEINLIYALKFFWWDLVKWIWLWLIINILWKYGFWNNSIFRIRNWLIEICLRWININFFIFIMLFRLFFQSCFWYDIKLIYYFCPYLLFLNIKL